MCERTNRQLVSDDLAEKSEANQKPLRVAKTPGCHVNGVPKSPLGKHNQHPLYSTWKTMRTRCNNPNRKDYDHYGGRGIKVCERWDNFDLFVQDMGPKPTSKHEIDRNDSNGNYCPENCKWSTRVEQLQHTSRNHYLTIGGEQLTISGWSRRSGLSVNLIKDRVARGWTHQDAVFTAPLKKWNDHKRRIESA